MKTEKPVAGKIPAKVAPAKTQTTGLVVQSGDIPDYLRGETTRGSENVGTNDLVIPRLELVQSLSPQRKKNDPAYIVGADEGMMFNNVTSELFTDALIVPVFFRVEHLLWKDRKKSGGQGGFRGAFPTKDEALAAIKELAEDGLEAVDTHQHFCLIVDPNTGKVGEIVMSMAKSKMKVSRKWNSLIRMVGGDRFSRVYRIRSVQETNQRNEDYFNFAVEQAGFPSKELYDRAVTLYDAISKGGVRVDQNFTDSDAAGDGESKDY